MAGNKIGGQRAAATNKLKYGPDFYAKIGAMGGKKGRTGGFFAMSTDDPDRFREISSKGGKISRRGKAEV